MRVTMGLLVLLALPAFAPAPFPRTTRQDKDAEVSLKFLQGKWAATLEIINEQGRPEHAPGAGVKSIVIKDDKWSHLFSTIGDDSTRAMTWIISLNHRTRPVSMEWYSDSFQRQKEPEMAGLVRRRGNVVEILFYVANREKRLKSFENPPIGWWYLTLRRAD
jgi:hypothetical protein